jgi:hypothetical protein
VRRAEERLFSGGRTTLLAVGVVILGVIGFISIALATWGGG